MTAQTEEVSARDPITAFSEADLELICGLQIAPRVSWSDLGSVLGRHPTTLANRWQRLRDAGAAWVTAHIHGHPHEMAVTFHDVRCEPGRRTEVIDALCAIGDVATVEECSRQKDAMLMVFAPSTGWLHTQLTPQLDAIPGVLQHQASYCTELHSTGFDWTMNVLSRSQNEQLRALAERRPYSPAPLPENFSDILQVLCRDGRATAADIAAATGLPPTTARRRLQRILDSGALTVRCDVAQAVAGYPLACQWYARLPVAQHRDAAQILRRCGALRLSASITGPSNLLFMFWLRNPAEVMEIERRLAVSLPDLRIDETTMISSIAKRMGWRLGADGRATGVVQAPGLAWTAPRMA